MLITMIEVLNHMLHRVVEAGDLELYHIGDAKLALHLAYADDFTLFCKVIRK